MRKIIDERQVPYDACLFRAPVCLADPIVDDFDEEEDEEDEERQEAADDAPGDAVDDGDAEDPAGEIMPEDGEAAPEDSAEDEDDAEDAEDDEDDEDEEPAPPATAAATDGRAFKVVANSGRPMRDVPFWGTLVVDLAGVKAKRRVPALVDHDPSKRVGVFESRKITRAGLVMRGAFMKRSKLARQINTELRDGFPWEASVRLHPTKVEEVNKGQTVEVNGRKVAGPAFVFRRSELRETSLCTLGADSNTSAAALSESPALSAEFSKTEATPPEPMTTSNADENRNEATDAERSRITTLQNLATPDQAELVARLIADGVDVPTAGAQLSADLRVRYEALRESRIAASDQALAAGNRGDESAPLARVRAMPESPTKWAKLFEFDPDLQTEFSSAAAYVAFESSRNR